MCRWEYTHEWHDLHKGQQDDTLEHFEEHYTSLKPKEKQVSASICKHEVLRLYMGQKIRYNAKKVWIQIAANLLGMLICAQKKKSAQ